MLNYTNLYLKCSFQSKQSIDDDSEYFFQCKSFDEIVITDFIYECVLFITYFASTDVLTTKEEICQTVN